MTVARSLALARDASCLASMGRCRDTLSRIPLGTRATDGLARNETELNSTPADISSNERFVSLSSSVMLRNCPRAKCSCTILGLATAAPPTVTCATSNRFVPAMSVSPNFSNVSPSGTTVWLKVNGENGCAIGTVSPRRGASVTNAFDAAGSAVDQFSARVISAASSARTSVLATTAGGSVPHRSSKDLEMSHHRIENVSFPLMCHAPGPSIVQSRSHRRACGRCTSSPLRIGSPR